MKIFILVFNVADLMTELADGVLPNHIFGHFYSGRVFHPPTLRTFRHFYSPVICPLFL